MNTMKRLLVLFLLTSLLLTAVSCGKEQEKESATETKELSPTEQAIADEKALKDFIQSYRAGGYKKQQMFVYDDLSQFYELGEYKGLEYPNDSMLDTQVTDEQVTDYLTGIQVVGVLKDEDFTELTSGKIEKFDTLKIDYRGEIDGQVQEKATATDQELLIGSNQFIEGFESGLIGKEIGTEVVLDLTFSPYYSAKEMAGKQIRFFVTVKSAKRPTDLPELTVEQVNTLYGSKFESMDAVREDIRGFLKQEKESASYSALADYLQNLVQKNSKSLELPDKEVEYFRKHYIKYYTQSMEADQSIDEFCEENLGVTYEEFDADALSYGKETVAGSLMLRLIAQKENITCSDEQLEALILGLYESQGAYYGNLQSFLADYVDLYGADYFENRIITAAAIEVVVDSAVKVG